MSIHELLTPQNCAVLFIDHQPQMLFGVASIERQLLINNTVGLAKAAKAFNVPTILTSVETKSFSGYIWPQLTEQFPDLAPIERTSMNSWEDEGCRAAVERTGRKKLVIAALWTEVCLTFPALEAIRDGYEVYAVADASGGTSPVAHDMAMQRMIQAGVVPVTWQQVLLEFQRDWAHKETYNATIEIAKEHSGAYGTGVEYAYTMVHGQPPSVPTPEPVKVGA
ncbi:hydrolase [Leptolyngbya cf. ectocarpi LEGE 11479]|uniref:Hydrolase n=1 Tax=Leptolyngbya cf. ectocarpi LEGE 11479 TaxID=1828722 RepID=A0A929F7D5_LEPEC|nr:hydrolase [Leptolyngbya ectocarpi]MBE9068181.1 hydrolase [Leptolyngbya cf. ectocarpi LEGE 11479]